MELLENSAFLEHVESLFEANNHMFTKTPLPSPCLVLLCSLSHSVPTGDETPQGDHGSISG